MDHKRLILKLKNNKLTMQDMKDLLKVEEDKEVKQILDELVNQGIDVDISQQKKRSKKMLYHINVLPENGNIFNISGPSKEYKSMRFGAISDIHFCSKYHLPKTFHATIDKLENLGVTKVYIAGDIVDGRDIYRGHLENLICTSIEDQTNVAAEALGKHPNISFFGVAGNHDYSFTKKNGAKPLAILEQKVDNFSNLGDLRADIIYNGINLRLLHGGSGRAYAKSYPSQTYLRDYFSGLNLQDMKKLPHIILLGHYHTLYVGKDHGIWIVQAGSFQDGDNEYCLRKGLTGPNGGFYIEFKAKKGNIEQFKTRYIEPAVRQKERGKAFKKTTINY